VITRAWLEVIERAGLEAMSYAVLPTIMGRRFLDENARHLEAIVRASLDRNSETSMRALIGALRSYPSAVADGPAIHCPVLLLTSPEDLIVSPAAAARVAASIHQVEHEEVPGVGHTIPIEAPAEWRERVIRFLES